MSETTSDTWYPRPEQAANANISEIIKLVGVKDYDELYRYSIERPADYWRAILKYCGVVWSKDYPPALPRKGSQWFRRQAPLDETIFRWAKNRLLVAQGGGGRTEDGAIVSVTYAGSTKGRAFAAGLKMLGEAWRSRRLPEDAEAVVTMIALSYMGGHHAFFSGFGVTILARLASCDARALIVTSGFRRRGKWINTAEVAVAARKRHPVEFLILKMARGETVPEGAIAWDSLPVSPVPDLAAEPMETNEPVMVFYTSGTTGKPKGTVHVHGGFPLKVMHDGTVHFDIKEGDVFFWPADMGWVAGALIITAVLTRGATMICYDGAPDFPDWSRMSRIIEHHKVTHFATAPTMIRGFAANPQAATAGDLSSIRLMITGGEVIDPEHFAWHAKHFGRGIAPLINFSGGTEASSGLVSSVIVKPILPGGFNTPTPGVAVDVVNADGKPVVDEVGELAVLAPFVGMTKSFWQDDERYLDTYWRTVPGIWIHGDLAIRKPTGDFFLRGRSDDTLKLAGKRIGPAEIDNVLMELPGVSECASIGVDDPAKGQMLVVFVIPSGDAKGDKDFDKVVAQYAETRLGKALRPGRVHIVTQLPKTRTAKVMRRVIRGVYTGTPTGDLSSLDNPAALEEIARAANREPPKV
jgi:acetyl-CoA synthetase